MNEIKEYNAYFTFAEISSDCVRDIEKKFKECGFILDLSQTSLEFESVGRDRNREVVNLFKFVARIIVDAEGEMLCEIDDDHKRDVCYEFYTISGGVLMLQRGKIVRDSTILPLR